MKNLAYLFQALLISIWWLGLRMDDAFAQAFGFGEYNEKLLAFFLVPDFILLVGFSVARAYKELKALEYIILGAFAYAALFCINVSLVTGNGLLASTVMSLGLGFNIFLVFTGKMFLISKENRFWVNGLKTFVQIFFVWTLTLLVIPGLIVTAFREEITFAMGAVQIIAGVLFLVFSLFGLYSSYHLVKFGIGTPLPLDQTQKLVVSGPYRWVRNPMAVAGIGQGVAVSMYLQSLPVLVYTLMGALLWQWFVRPAEEEDMYKRFGEEYWAYKQEVKCWLPRYKSEYQKNTI